MHTWPDGQVREEEPYRCGAFVASTGEQCTLLSDHEGPHQFAPTDEDLIFNLWRHAFANGCDAVRRVDDATLASNRILEDDAMDALRERFAQLRSAPPVDAAPAPIGYTLDVTAEQFATPIDTETADPALVAILRATRAKLAEPCRTCGHANERHVCFGARGWKCNVGPDGVKCSCTGFVPPVDAETRND